MSNRSSVALAAALVSASAMCQTRSLPAEVRAFISERETCEHFLGEVDDRNTPERAKRQTFVSDSIDIYCAGTDRRLAALKRRYHGNSAVMKRLNALDEKLE
jgi:hypothetical protein